jgi:hypothetical protein
MISITKDMINMSYSVYHPSNEKLLEKEKMEQEDDLS